MKYGTVVFVLTSLFLAACAGGETHPERRAKLLKSRSRSEICTSDSANCQKWTELAVPCEENMKRREEGYMGKLEPWCSQMEEFREQVTGIPVSSDPRAYSF